MITLKKRLFWVFILLFGLGNTGWALTEQNNQPKSMTLQQQQIAAASMDKCPPPNKLIKEGLLWHANGGWVSYGESFDTKVDHFIKAEWIGINVGKVICLYKGDKRLGFPIALEQKYHKLVPLPSGFDWNEDEDPKRGYKECYARDINRCPFLFKSAEEDGDIYKNLDFYKGQPDIDD